VDVAGLMGGGGGEKRVAIDTPPVRQVRYSAHAEKIRFVIETEPAALLRHSVKPVDGGFSILIRSGGEPAAHPESSRDAVAGSRAIAPWIRRGARGCFF
jgi:hypothetical protein